MPSKKGELSQKDKDLVRAWLDEKWTQSKLCPISGTADWILNDHLVTPVAMGASQQGGAVVATGPSYPHVMLTCQDCGFTRFFNAVLMGLMAPSPEPVSEGVPGAD